MNLDTQEISEELKQRLKNIKMLVMDVDGVMTDGGLTIGDDGQEYKTFHSQDGLGMKLLKNTGIQLAIITGRTSNVVTKRAKNTGITHFYQGAEDKLEAFYQLLEAANLQAHQCAFMGDDVVDLPPMLNCGLAIAVPNSMPMVLQHAHYITKKSGGKGAVREVCELIMQAQGTFESQMALFLTRTSMSN